ncbi:MAG: hypothetical protein KF861_07195, partial [Planctomycetaceae bacterium]|nr:hypothetical protein [Planctomycetaceae bacterium]
VKLRAETEYEYRVEGTWTLEAEGTPVDADGVEEGGGRLIGVVFADYRLSAPVELGASGTFVAPADGDLYLRCRDDWGSLADNQGTLIVSIKNAERVPSTSVRRLARPAGPPAKSASPPMDASD